MDKLQLQLRDELSVQAPYGEVWRLVHILATRRELVRIVHGERCSFYRLSEHEALPTDAALLVDGKLPQVVRVLQRAPEAREEECLDAISECLDREARRGGWAGPETVNKQLRATLGLELPYEEAYRLLHVLATRRELVRIVHSGGRSVRSFYRTAEHKALPTTDAALLVDGKLPQVVRTLRRVPATREEECLDAIPECLDREARRGGWAGFETINKQLRARLGLELPYEEAYRLLHVLATRRELVRIVHSGGRSVRSFFRLSEHEALPTTDAALLVDGVLPRIDRLLRVAVPAASSYMERARSVVALRRVNAAVDAPPSRCLVVVDGANVAMRYDSRGEPLQFSPAGIALAVDWFRQRGHDCFAFLPAFAYPDMAAVHELVADGRVVATPPQHVDDLYAIEHARANGGYVLSNDLFRDHLAAPAQRAWVAAHVIPYTWRGDEIVPHPAGAQRALDDVAWQRRSPAAAAAAAAGW